EQRAAVRIVVERAGSTELDATVEIDTGDRREEAAEVLVVDRLRHQHARARHVRVELIAVEEQRHLELTDANSEFGAQLVVDVRPVDDRLVVAFGPEVLREDLNAAAQVGAELLRHVEAGLEELEAAALGVS